MPFFVNAPPTVATRVPDGSDDRPVTGPGCVVAAADGAEALRIVQGYRDGAAWTIGLDVRVVQ